MMNINVLSNDLRELYHERTSFWVHCTPSFRSPQSQIQWKLGPVFTERETDGYDSIYKSYMTEVSGTCVATQIEGPNSGLQGIAKIRMQIPDDPPSSTEPHRGSSRCGYELYNLGELTKLGCTSTPKLLDIAFFDQTENDPVPGGFRAIIVMERLPGRNLENFGELPLSERDQVRLAFAKAIREFYSLRFIHNDPARRNLMWDHKNKKCYIIDLEDACLIDDSDEPTKFVPENDFYSWGIAGPEINTSIYGLDPMVPYDRKYIEDPDDETLEKMAAEAAGKEILFPEYDFTPKSKRKISGI